MKTRTAILFLPLIFLFHNSCVKENTSPENDGSSSGSNVNKATMLQLVNNARQNGCMCGTTNMPSVPPLEWNQQLEIAAVSHSKDMIQNKFFSHTGTDGSSPGDRIIRAGYNWKSYGENIAYNQGGEDLVVEAWLKSEGHCKNIMSRNFVEFAVARQGGYWTQDFGVR